MSNSDYVYHILVLSRVAVSRVQQFNREVKQLTDVAKYQARKSRKQRYTSVLHLLFGAGLLWDFCVSRLELEADLATSRALTQFWWDAPSALV